jgi:hypothetical protein
MADGCAIFVHFIYTMGIVQGRLHIAATCALATIFFDNQVKDRTVPVRWSLFQSFRSPMCVFRY